MRDQTRGAILGLSAAALFGVSAPVAKALLPGSTPLTFGALLYVGAGIALTILRVLKPAQPDREARLQRRDFLSLAAVIGLGGVAGPVLMLHGLQRVSGVSGSLALNLEGPFTILVAVAFFGEHLSRRAVVPVGCIFAGAVALNFPATSWSADAAGLLLLASACACWAFDNNLSQRLSLRDPVAVVRAKALGAGGAMSATALAFGHPLPEPRHVAAGLVLGAVSYGLSIVLDMRALRLLGAARQAAYFATAPFIGALIALPVLGESLRPTQAIAGGFMVIGVGLLVRERHSHSHTHPAVVHEHAHEHDDHHQHAHDGPVTEPHSHVHAHVQLTHDHPHVSDLHHRHGHD